MDKAIIKGFERYYKSLSDYGKVSSKSVNKLIIAYFIYKILYWEYFKISKQDYDLLSDLYNMIEGDCLIPYKKYCQKITVNKHDYGSIFRYTELPFHNDNLSDPRLLESNNLRTI